MGHTPVYIRFHSWQCMLEQKPSHEAEGTACRAQRQDCVEAQIWGRLQKHFLLHWMSPKACLEETRPRSSPAQYCPYGEAWWWKHHALGVFISGRYWWLVRVEGKLNGAKYRYILIENLVESAEDLRLGRWFTFQRDSDPKHTAKTRQEWLRDNARNVLKLLSQSLEPNQTSLEKSENVCWPMVPI